MTTDDAEVVREATGGMPMYYVDALLARLAEAEAKRVQVHEYALVLVARLAEAEAEIAELTNEILRHSLRKDEG